MGPQYVYTMKGLGKRYPPDHTVLQDIWLSFLPGAKIGVLGLNGAGKSTLLRIMAGEITEFDGEAFRGCERGALMDAPLGDNREAQAHPRGTPVIDYTAYKLATHLIARRPGQLTPFENLEALRDISSWGEGGVIGADRLERLRARVGLAGDGGLDQLHVLAREQDVLGLDGLLAHAGGAGALWRRDRDRQEVLAPGIDERLRQELGQPHGDDEEDRGDAQGQGLDEFHGFPPISINWNSLLQV